MHSSLPYCCCCCCCCLTTKTEATTLFFLFCPSPTDNGTVWLQRDLSDDTVRQEICLRSVDDIYSEPLLCINSTTPQSDSGPIHVSLIMKSVLAWWLLCSNSTHLRDVKINIERLVMGEKSFEVWWPLTFKFRLANWGSYLCFPFTQTVSTSIRSCCTYPLAHTTSTYPASDTELCKYMTARCDSQALVRDAASFRN